MDVGLVDLDGLALLDAHAVETLRHGEQALQHARQREVRTQVLFGDGQAFALHAFRMECHIPCFELRARKRLELRELTLGGRPAQARQPPQELQHLGGIARHLGGQRIVREAGESRELRGLVPQRQDFLDQRAVVPLRRTLLRGARDPGRVEVLAQLPIFGVCQDCLVIRCVQREDPAAAAVLFGFGACTGDDRGGQAGEFSRVLDDTRPGIGGVEHVLVELRLRRRQALHEFAEALLVCGRERDTGEPEVTQRIVDELALFRLQGGVLRVLDALVGRAQRSVLRDLGVIRGEQGQARVIGGPQFVAVGNAVEMAHGRPGAREPMLHAFDGNDDAVPAFGPGIEQLLQAAPVLFEHLPDGGLDVLRADREKSGQGRVVQERVVHAAILAARRPRIQPNAPCSSQPSAYTAATKPKKAKTARLR